MIRILITTFLLSLPLPALAHNVIASVFPSGTDIEGEIGMSDGTMAPHVLVEVYDESGTKLGETATDQNGFFIYTPTQPVAHIFHANLGAGHLAQIMLPGTEVARIMGQAAREDTKSASTFSGAANTFTPAASELSAESRAEIAAMLRQELRPLRQELTAFKNKTTFQSVLGGIGYIFGLFGLGFYIAARRKVGDTK